MLIAVLALLGVDLIVIVAFAAFVVSRGRWVSRQPGAFRGTIRIATGAVEAFGPKWRRGYGRWVHDVLVWTKGPSPRPGRTILVGEQTELAGAVDRFGPRGSLQLAMNGDDLALDRVASDVQLVTDLAQ